MHKSKDMSIDSLKKSKTTDDGWGLAISDAELKIKEVA
jgi:hypothetical protein